MSDHNSYSPVVNLRFAQWVHPGSAHIPISALLGATIMVRAQDFLRLTGGPGTGLPQQSADFRERP